MRRSWLPSLVGALVLALSATARGAEIYGDYLEARSADVWTGPCFANAEAGLVGREAILAWHIQKGAWHGVPLDGLSVVGVVKAKATLGDPFATPYPARAVIIVDENASPDQRAALLALAQDMTGEMLMSVVRTEVAPIRLEVRHDRDHPTTAILEAGDLATVETRTLNENDRHCGNEETYYPPLAATSSAMPAVSVLDRYRGPGLGVTWTTRDKRNAFVGSFAR